MIDKRELLEKSRKKQLNLAMIEKDYVLGWLLFGFSGTDLIFKGGTALSKIYFPRIWRLSEDLDFSLPKGNFDQLKVSEILDSVAQKSGIWFRLKNEYRNPEYLQLKIQYNALLGKNWAKIDVTTEKVFETLSKKISKTYSDYPSFSMKVMSIEEIFAEKLRAILERNKTRDYYDIWRILSLDIDKRKVRKIFLKKVKVKDLGFKGTDQFFPDDLEEILKPYWERELSRLINEVPNMSRVLRDIENKIQFLD
ncbi:MAG: hypothetical protein GF368_01875 [Candidatus Aenigmarchaeota archaeon]|nr:hypothetical protein [Candidatus Aenigmarchaeota archaeon]